MNGTVTHADGTTAPATAQDVQGRCQGSDFFWLDLDGLDDEAPTSFCTASGSTPWLLKTPSTSANDPSSTLTTGSPTWWSTAHKQQTRPPPLRFTSSIRLGGW